MLQIVVETARGRINSLRGASGSGRAFNLAQGSRPPTRWGELPFVQLLGPIGTRFQICSDNRKVRVCCTIPSESVPLETHNGNSVGVVVGQPH